MGGGVTHLNIESYPCISYFASYLNLYSFYYLIQTALKNAKLYLILGILFNLALLGFFKYTDFLLENFNLFSQLLHLDFNIPLPHILLPLGLSFVTFQQIAFLVDCYKRIDISNMQEAYDIKSKERDFQIKQYSYIKDNDENKMRAKKVQQHKIEANGDRDSKNSYKSKENNFYKDYIDIYTQSHIKQDLHIKSKIDFIDYALFVSFFPQLIAGPIVHHKEMMSQFGALKNNSYVKWDYITKGLFIFSIGLFKKVFIADSFAKWANAGFGVVENGGVLTYTFQLYFDFSGYCDMEIGLGLFFGIMLPINFNSPYKALNISEFWRKWHITLGRFLKEYVYIPLEGNRNTKYKDYSHYGILNKLLTLRNLFIIALLSGI
ncbi:alginate O- acetylation protein [Helicobacter muridarum]|uniref:Alginate O- acetylation protein n=2 Tax=Helicobacter muridarum TaxID=216 RepID=A0A377PTA9_9HELI|nr:alginate O- acetylation protein [Helicobacter muridarum]